MSWIIRWRFTAAAVVVLTAVAVTGLVLAFSSGGGRSSSQRAALPLGAGQSRATLVVASGTPDLSVTTENLGSALVRASVTAGAPVRPVLSLNDGARLTLTSAPGTARKYTVDIVLSTAVTWTLDFDAGTQTTDADLRGAKIGDVTFGAGSDVIDLSLPRPSGTSVIRLAGGASQFQIALPAGVPARVTAAAGAGTMALDSTSRTGVAGGTVVTPPGWASARDRFDVDAVSGVDQLVVSRWLPGIPVFMTTSYAQPGTVLTDHVFPVPLDHGRPDGEQIEVFAREVAAASMAGRDDIPWLLFLQGGPGFPAQRPIGREGWLDRALRDYRVLLLDQRGTGRSTPVSAASLAARGDAAAQAQYLTYFRADSIVLDAELIRTSLLGDVPWSVLGQSFGGFCVVSYLSFAPHGLCEALITGGLPGLAATADEVYRATYPRVAAKNAAHYARYPGDAEVAVSIAGRLAGSDIRLPDGAPLTVEAFQSLGKILGSGSGSHRLHYLLEAGADSVDGGWLYEMQSQLSFAGAPLYTVLHEACYAQGSATRWAAQRVRAEFGEFSPDAKPLLFTGEMIYPWMLGNDPVLRPMRDAADILAERDDWPALYDPARLAANEVPVAAAVYFDDMYVDPGFSLATAGAIRGLRRWVTSEYEHDGLRVSGGKVLDRLIGMVRGES